MSVTLNPAERRGGRAWRMSWSSDQPSPTYYLYLAGARLAVTTDTSIDLGGADVPQLDVFDSAAGVPNQTLYPGRVVIQWYDAAGTPGSYFRVEEWTGSAWAFRAPVPAALGYLTWSSPWLDDGAAVRYRVVPTSADGVTGDAAQHDLEIVRNPDAPRVRYGYSGGNLTVAA